MTLSQLIGVAYQAVCELMGVEKADETLAEMAAAYELQARPRVSASERQARQDLLRAFGMGGVTSSPA